jgi:CheY-like chemotaxis protein
MNSAAQQFAEWNGLYAQDVQQKRILVVEDDPFWQSVIRRNILKASDSCKIKFVTNADDAVALLGTHHCFSLIIADQFLDGEGTGYDLWRNLQLRGIQVPFLLTSGKVNFPEDFPTDMSPRFISKPFVASEIRGTLDDLLNSDLPANYFAAGSVDWSIENEDRLGATFVLAVGALLALAVYTATTPSLFNGLIGHPREIVVPPPQLDLFKSHHGRVANAPRTVPLELTEPQPKIKTGTRPGLETRIQAIIENADKNYSKSMSSLQLMKVNATPFEWSE